MLNAHSEVAETEVAETEVAELKAQEELKTRGEIASVYCGNSIAVKMEGRALANKFGCREPKIQNFQNTINLQSYVTSGFSVSRFTQSIVRQGFWG